MRSTLIVSRILVVLGAAAAASCGGSDSTSGGTKDAATDTMADGGSVDSPGDTGADSPSDADDTQDTGIDVPCVRRPFLVMRRRPKVDRRDEFASRGSEFPSHAEPRAGTLVERDDWSTSMPPIDGDMHEATRRALAEAWREDGRQEHASIAAFARFTMLALAVGAPPEIVAASNRAGLDEIRHARGCFALADRYANAEHSRFGTFRAQHSRFGTLRARKYGPGAISLEGALRPLCLAELAALTVHEGCVGETLGVLLASEQLAQSKDPAVRAFLEKLVRDEMRHSELAWSFVRWAIEVGDASVHRAVENAFDEAIAATLKVVGADPDGIDVDVWHAHGRLVSAEVRALVRRGVREIIAPCRAALVAKRAIEKASSPVEGEGVWG